MVIWIVLSAMTALSVMAVLWPLSRRYAVSRQTDPETRFYHDQIAEIERDRDRGVLMPDEAEAAKAEAGRRLLRATGTHGGHYAPLGEPALRRRRAASALALSGIPILALAVYGAYGSPHLLSHPPASEARANAGELDLAAALGQIESHLKQNPQDGRGWEVVAPVYLRLGRIDDAVRAYEAALRHLGPDAARLANYGEALVFAKDGLVTAEAQDAFERAVRADRGVVKARFYLARAAEQDGRQDKARQAYADLLAEAPPDAPWADAVRRELVRLGGQAQVAGRAPTPQIDGADIARMVSGLAERLESQGGTAEEWARLMRSYAVLGQKDNAAAAARRARQALAQDDTALKTIDAMAKELQLTDLGK